MGIKLTTLIFDEVTTWKKRKVDTLRHKTKQLKNTSRITWMISGSEFQKVARNIIRMLPADAGNP